MASSLQHRQTALIAQIPATGTANTRAADVPSRWDIGHHVVSIDLVQNIRQANGASIDGLVESINKRGIFIGESWDDVQGIVTAYVGKKAKYKEEIDPNVSGSSIRGRGINTAGDMVGYFTSSHIHGFLIHNGVTTVIDYPGARDTRLESINDKGLISGYWTPDGTIFHAFFYDQNTSTFAQIDVVGSSFTTGFGINNDGNLMINSDFGFYVFCPKSKQKCPAGGTEVLAPKQIHVDPASFLRYGDVRAIKVTPASLNMADGERPKRFGTGVP